MSSDSEMLILQIWSVYIDISVQGAIDLPCCWKKRLLLKRVTLPSAML